MNDKEQLPIVLPGYQVVEMIGANPRLKVYRGYRNHDRQPVILKVAPTDSASLKTLARLKHEYELIRHLEHPDRVKAFALRNYKNRLVLVFEDIGGESLQQILESSALSAEHCLDIFLAIARQLAIIHEKKVIHRDINPSNLIVNQITGQVQITDFSISTRLSRENQKARFPHFLEGTLAYISPEQTGRMNRAVDFRTDFYSLGVTFYQALTGVLPFKVTDPMELIHCHIAKTPSPPDEIERRIPAALSAIVMKLMSKNAEDRYQSAAGLIFDLERYAAAAAEPKPSPFPLGEGDFPSQFEIPQKLFGRDDDLAQLMAAYERVSLGGIEIMLISGRSGAGKSALIHEIHKPMSGRPGFLITGKSDQLQRNIPYGSLIRAFRKLIRQLAAVDEKRLKFWRARIVETLGANAQLMSEVLPELEWIIGKPSPTPPLPTAEAENRFHLVFRNFVGAFARIDHPLVIFLDDLQWADSATLKLIRALAIDPEIRSLFLIGAYREKELSEADPLLSTLDEIRKSQATVTTLSLGPLEEPVILQMIAETLRRSPAETTTLAKHVLERTRGNPFFVIEYLKHLYAEGFLTFDRSRQAWDWDLVQIERAGMTEDVGEIMIEKIRKLPKPTREALQFAACIGNQFDIKYLSIVSDRSAAEVVSNLWPALEEGLIGAIDNPEVLEEPGGLVGDRSFIFEFLHDRIHRACYALMPAETRKKTHVHIARSLLKHTTEDHLDEQIFDIVNQYNLGIEYLDSPDERIRLARMSLFAGKKARLASAYDPALDYLHIGMAILPEDRWRSHYQLTLDLFKERAGCELLCGHREKAEHLFEEVLSRVQTVLEMAEVYNVRTVLYTHLGLYAEAVETGMTGLDLLGLSLPDQDDQLKVAIDARLGEIRDRLQDRDIEGLIHLPRISDPHIHATLNQLITIWAPAVNVNRNLMNMAILEIVNRSLIHGNTDISSCGYVGYGLILGSGFGEYEKGETFGKIAIKLLERSGGQEQACQVYFLYGAFVRPWRRHFKTSLPYLRKAYHAGLETGHLTWAASSAFHLTLHRMMSGDPLRSVHEECGALLRFLGGIREEHTHEALRVTQRLIEILESPSTTLEWDSDSFHASTFLEQIQRKMFIIALVHYYNARSQAAFFFDQFDESARYAAEAEKFSDYNFGWPSVAEQWFFSALSEAASFHGKPKNDQPASLEKIRAYAEKLKQLGRVCPENFQHRYLLVLAEIARLENRTVDALNLYDQAIESAAEQEYTQIEALGCELAGKFFMLLNKARIARVYLRDACFLYGQWGAAAKVRRLQRIYPFLKEETNKVPVLNGATTSTEDNPGLLDMSTFIKASRALSSEIHYEKLLEKLIQIMLESAGAREGFLILANKGRLRIEARGSVEQSPPVHVEPSPLDDHQLARSIIHYVFNTREPVILGNAVREGPFTADPHIVRNQPKSLLCIPIIYKANPMGALYLENNLVTGVFTPERLEVLRLLASEAAVSIENARLFTNLEKASRRLKQSYEKLEEQNRTLELKVDERTRELRDKNLELKKTLDRLSAMQQQIIQQEKLASLGTLTAGIAHEMRNPLNFVNNFSELSVDIAKDLEQDLEALLAKFPPDQQTREIKINLDDLVENIRRINEHGRRADGIVHAMLRHSHEDQVSKPEPTDLNALLQEYVHLTHEGKRTKDPTFELKIETDYDPNMEPILAVPQDLSRVFINIVDNACYAISEKKKKLGPGYQGILRVTTQDQEDWVEIRFRDNGLGIPKKIMNKIFNPFFTTKPTGVGTGLGLLISHDIVVNEHQGVIQVQSEPNRFSEFIIRLPKI